MKTGIFSIGNAGRVLCGGISFSVERGECVLLCGANGSGKTTLMRTLAGLQKPLDGENFGEDLKVTMLPTRVPKVKGFTVREFMLLPKDVAPAGAEKALARLKADAFMDRDLSPLSDGEFQKVCIASGLARRSDLLLLDEPASFLDLENRRSVLLAIRDAAHSSGTAIMFSCHDIHDALTVADRTLAFSAPDAQGIVRLVEATVAEAMKQAALSVISDKSITFMA